MLSRNYKSATGEGWYGRVDSTEDFDAFRWHQWVELIDLNDEELKPFEGQLGFVFLGFKSDYGIQLNKGRVGAKNGPESIRSELSNKPCTFSKELKLFDAGNIEIGSSSLEEAQDALAEAVDKILSLNLFPIILGGGHETAFGHYKGLMKNLESVEHTPNIGIINFDAHFDIRPYPNGGTSGTMFRQIHDLCLEKEIPYNYFCLGIQQHSNTVNLFKTAEEFGVKHILAKDLLKDDYYSTFEKLDDYIREQEHIYITICSDVFSSAFAPGVSSPQPLGLDPERVIILLKHILTSGKTISFDIAEVSPKLDNDNITANLASVIIFTLVATLARIEIK